MTPSYHQLVTGKPGGQNAIGPCVLFHRGYGFHYVEFVPAAKGEAA